MATAIIMPKFEMAQEAGTVIRWLKEEGESVTKGEPILEVETDKVTMDVEAFSSGVLRGICAWPGDEVPIGQPIAYLVAVDEEWSPPERGAAQAANPAPASPSSLRATPVAQRMAREHGLDLSAVQPAKDGERVKKEDVRAYLDGRPLEESEGVRAVPAARRIAHEMHIVLESVSGSGPGGRIQSEDVRRAALLQTEEALPVPERQGPAVRRRTPLSSLRRTIARRMTASARDVPQFTVSLDVNMTRALAMVEDLNVSYEREKTVRVTLTAFLVKACAWTLKRHPEVNVSFEGSLDREAQLVEYSDINIGVAIAVEDGLLVPVLHQADRLGLRAIGQRLSDLVTREQTHQLRLEDMQAGTFTISNLGMFGIDRFTAIVNTPEAAILAVGRVQKQPFITEENDLVEQPRAEFTLTADHRVLDGAMAARFLATLQRAVEHPGLLLE